ncbi:MAG: RNase P subunit p30 family protein [Candidatus Hermodarchaeota archaeon]
MSYFESRLPIDFNNLNEAERKIELCKELGIKNIILEPIRNKDGIPFDFRDKVKKMSEINIYFRINLKLKDLEEFKKKIKKYNNFQDILSIESLNKEVQLQSAKDSRVDIVSFSDPEILKTLTPGVISLTKQNNSFIEFSLAPLMVSNKTLQSKNFRNLYKNIQLAINSKANYIISGNFIDNYNFRHPRALLSVCHSLLGIPLNIVKKVYIKNPQMLVKKSKNRYEESLKKQTNNLRGE